MREIKFRAWDKIKNRFIDEGEISFCFYGETRLEVRPNSPSYAYDYCEEQYNVLEGRFIVTQYTGLHDKNGKEVYEGDIVLGRFVLDDVENHIFLQLTDEEKKNQAKKFVIEDIFYPYTHQIPEDLEVIGNIYEHENLLENESKEV